MSAYYLSVGTLRAPCALALLLALTAVAAPRPSGRIEHAHGRAYTCLYAWGRDGSGPPNTGLQICTPVDRKPGYRLSLFEDDPPHHLIWTKAYPAPIRFTGIEVHANPANDIWEEGGHHVKQFPSLLFVGHGSEHGRPVTLVWSPGQEGNRSIRLVLKVFGGDASRLDQPEHGKREIGGILVEHAMASWIPANTKPRWANSRERIKRVWIYSSQNESFRAGKWRRDR